MSSSSSSSPEVEPVSVKQQQSNARHEAFPQLYRRALRDSTSSGTGAGGGGGSGGSSSTQKRTSPPLLLTPVDDDRVEYPPMSEEKRLGAFSTAALIVSKMIGTGVFAKPAVVLLNSGGKSVALGMWLVGGAMTLCGVLIYIELGIALPFNGGEIVYVEEAYPTPKYLAVIIISLLFVLLSHNAGNCISFAKLVLQAFEPTEKDPDFRLQKFIALVMLTAVCLLHVFSRNMGIAINNLLALYKLALVSFIVLVGFAAMAGGRGKGVTGGGEYGLANFADAADVRRMSMNEYANAALGVLWAYTGWENANYVLAEVKRPPGRESRVFKVAALGSIGTVTLLYVLANVAYFTVLTTDEIAEEGDMVAIKFLLKVFGDGWFIQRGMKVFIALSILGNFISFTYGVARVKQEIAKLRILPFSKFWAKQSHYDTPVGALLLHWIFAALIIIVTPNNRNDDAYNLITNLFIHAQNWIIITVSLGVFALRYHSKFRAWKPQLMSWNILLGIVSIYAPMNLFVIILTWWPPHVQPSIPSFVTPGVASCIIVFGFGYWVVFAKVLPALGYHIDSEPDELVDGSRVVMYKRYKTGFAKRAEDWLEENVWQRRR